MKHIIILGDGMADWPDEKCGGKTLLQYARTPHMDHLARLGRNGLLKTVADGFHPGSEVANMSVLGYHLPEVYEGRGVLEAANIGVELQPGDLAMRCNLVCIEGELLKNHSAGHISTEEADELIGALNRELGNERVHFYTGVQYRHLLVIKGGSKHLETIPPHDVPLRPYRPLMTKSLCKEAEETACLINELVMKSQQVLERHAVNQRRLAAGKDPANSIWPWSPGYRPRMELLSKKYPQIRRGSVISAVDLINGIGYYAGLRRIKVEGATGLFDTNYENKVQAALQALQEDDFVYLHVEASDEAGHEGDYALKQRTIEDLDNRVVGPILEPLASWQDPVAIAVLPDHPTRCRLRTHTADPVPFVMYYPGIDPDDVSAFSEIDAKNGSYGLLKEDEFMNLFMQNK